MLNRLQSITVAACALVAIAALVLSVVFVLHSNEQIHQIKATRAAAQVAVCLSYNSDLVANVNALNDRTQGLLRAAVAPTPQRTPAAQALAQQFLDGQVAQFNAIKIKPRDCSPQGIADFYKRGAK